MILTFHLVIMIIILFLAYYILPKRYQPLLLLAGSLYYYYYCSGILILVMMGTSLIAFLFGHLIYKYRIFLFQRNLLNGKGGLKLLCSCCIILLLFPLFGVKYSSFFLQFFSNNCTFDILDRVATIGLPIGISFYTLQLISYCIDIYRGKSEPESNFLHFLLYTCFFPQILQGPIPRYENLKKTLFASHDFEESIVTMGLIKILCGLFLKYMIADKAAIFVNAVFNADEHFSGAIYLTAGIFYSFQLYTDFLSCVLLAQGIALLFDIKLSENFAQPYFALSIKDFWRRWHISLSSWLKDYVYIPLGGNQKGNFRTNLNMLITFGVSGIWHGAGYKYLFWGLIHGVYQIIGKSTSEFREHFFHKIKIPSVVRTSMQRISTFFLVMPAWIIFRANSLRDGLYAIYSIIFDFHPIGFTNMFSYFSLSLEEVFVLLVSIVLLLFYDHRTAMGGEALSDALSRAHPIKLFLFSVAMLSIIIIFGTYGIGYDANAFIYGGF